MTQQELDTRIEKIVKRKVKFYYSDWKNYDRPKYMKLKGNDTDICFLLARTCGTYLLTADEIANNPGSKSIYDYFTTQEPADVYKISLKNNSIKLVTR